MHVQSIFFFFCLIIYITYIFSKGALNIISNYCYRNSISCEQNKQTHASMEVREYEAVEEAKETKKRKKAMR